MGYYTAFSLHVHKNFNGALYDSFHVSIEVEREVMKELCVISNMWNKDSIIEYDEPFDMISEDIYKWYNHESDMLNLSRMFPNLWFILEGHGEEWNDIWRDLYHNGEVEHQVVEMNFPDFNRKRWRG